MKSGAGPWTVRIAAAAEADFRQILQSTSRRFGRSQAPIYAEAPSAAIAALTSGPSGPGVRHRGEIAKGVLTLHVARKGRKGRHFNVFRIRREAGIEAIDVLRILHEAMDFPRHLTPDRERD